MKMHDLRHHLAAIGAYVLATILLTYPTATQMGSHIPGGGDAPWFLWQLWWFKHSLIDLLQSPLTTDLIYYPLKDVPSHGRRHSTRFSRSRCNLRSACPFTTRFWLC
jgi:hypothetical protein